MASAADTLNPSVVDGRPVVGVDPDADMLLEPCSQQNTDSMNSRPRELSVVVGSPMAGQPTVSPEMPDTDYQPSTHTISVKRYLERLNSVKSDSSDPYFQLCLLKHQPGCINIENNDEITDLDECAKEVKRSTTQLFSAFKVLYPQRIRTLTGLWEKVSPQLRELFVRYGFYASEDTVQRELSLLCFVDGCRIPHINLETFKLEMLVTAHSKSCKLIRQLCKKIEVYKEFNEIIAKSHMSHSTSKDSGLNMCFEEALLSPLRRRSDSIDSFQSYGDDSSFPHTPNSETLAENMEMEVDECPGEHAAKPMGDTNNNEIDEDPDALRLCVICTDASAVIVAMPCEDMSFCKSCFVEYLARNNGLGKATCPYCRKVIESYISPRFCGFARQ
ncbi:RING finger protein [Kistimonas asteriae]|uniref:RING finger protein n=1 Tax=Kistimonas asteriae TaxID=517724 RepID=UPI001BA83B85|nr:RING finger protein [Kistimonas asteriae]